MRCCSSFELQPPHVNFLRHRVRGVARGVERPRSPLFMTLLTIFGFPLHYFRFHPCRLYERLCVVLLLDVKFLTLTRYRQPVLIKYSESNIIILVVAIKSWSSIFVHSSYSIWKWTQDDLKYKLWLWILIYEYDFGFDYSKSTKEWNELHCRECDFSFTEI